MFMSLPYTTRITKTNTTPIFFFFFLSHIFFTFLSSLFLPYLYFTPQTSSLWHNLDPRLFRFKFPPFPQQVVLFIYGTWTVAATFDRSSMNSTFMHCSRTHKFHFLSIFSLKIGPTVLFTHLKIILVQYFQFSVFIFSKISSIQTDP